MPRSIWGKVQREWKDWDVSAFAEVESEAPNQASIELEADHEDEDIILKISAVAGEIFSNLLISLCNLFLFFT